MKLKKYTASTEDLAMELVAEELGSEALILNVKKVQPKGIKAIFRRQQVEITAAYDDSFTLLGEEPKKDTEVKSEGLTFLEQIGKHNVSINANDNIDEDNSQDSYSVETKIKDDFYFARDAIFMNQEIKNNSTNDEKLLNSISQTSKREIFEADDLIRSSHYHEDVFVKDEKLESRAYKNECIQMIYQTLINEGVEGWIAGKILEDVDKLKDIDDINVIVKIVYNKILSILGETEPIDISSASRGNPKIISFLGPTGVGKTTTIAKLSSHFILSENIEVGLLTSDTYRIAAIEQLKTYAEILNIDVKVVYDNLELVDNLIFMGRQNGLIMIDTAGRSHKNLEMMGDLKNLLSYIEGSENYLVLSLTTKSSDLIEIINSYKEFVDFKIIFTKLDETNNLGSILNVCYQTGKKASYLTTGQSVPDDIEPMNRGKVAKSVLGLGGGS